MARPNLSPSLPVVSHGPLNASVSASRPHQRKSRSPIARRTSLQQPHTSYSYEHFSALRSTHEAPLPTPMQSLFSPGCDAPEGCGFHADNGYDCQECTQHCEDGSCTLGLTSQCTDQCVVVPCNDTHDEEPLCEQLAAPLPCGKQCPTEQCPAEFDCNVFDQFVSILPLSLLVVFCVALLRYSRTLLTSHL